jgi:hypothetical protein
MHKTKDSMTDMFEKSPVAAAMRAIARCACFHDEYVQHEVNDPPEVEVSRLRELICQLLQKNEKLRQCLADILPASDCVDSDFEKGTGKLLDGIHGQTQANRP